MSAPTDHPGGAAATAASAAPASRGAPRGRLLLVPTPLAQPDEAVPWLAEADRQRVAALTRFYVETPKTARVWLKQLPVTTPLPEIDLRALPAADDRTVAWGDWLAPLVAGNDVGLMSDAGCPGVADPGAALVAAAQAAGVTVLPIAGPSSILLGLMASGLEGQRFAFHGYLPVAPGDREEAIRELARRSAGRGETQILIETPYRNEAMAQALLAALPADTRLCVASDLGGRAQVIRTRRVADWRQAPPTLDRRRPAIFLFLATRAAARQRS